MVDHTIMYICPLSTLSNLGERKVFSWGRGDYGQLGRDIKSEGANQTTVCCPTPIGVPTLENVRQVSDVMNGTVMININAVVYGSMQQLKSASLMCTY